MYMYTYMHGYIEDILCNVCVHVSNKYGVITGLQVCVHICMVTYETCHFFVCVYIHVDTLTVPSHSTHWLGDNLEPKCPTGKIQL